MKEQGKKPPDLQQYNPTSRNKKTLKQTNLTPKAIRERTKKPPMLAEGKKSQRSDQK